MDSSSGLIRPCQHDIASTQTQGYQHGHSAHYLLLQATLSMQVRDLCLCLFSHIPQASHLILKVELGVAPVTPSSNNIFNE